MHWNTGDHPPATWPGQWSRPVIAVTNLGNIYRLSHDGEGWQRIASMKAGECVEWWIHFPAPPNSPIRQPAS